MIAENGFGWFRNPDRQKGTKCSNCDFYEACKGDSLHTWDFTNQEPKICLKDHMFGDWFRKNNSEKILRNKMQFYYPKMKGIRITYNNSSDAKLIFTPSAAKQLLTYFEWGERSPRNCFELLAGLAGFVVNSLIVVEHIIPGNLELYLRPIFILHKLLSLYFFLVNKYLNLHF